MLATPAILLRLWWRGRDYPPYRKRWGERFGRVARPGADIAVWLHAVSVGETLAAAPLINALIARYGEGRVWITTTTPTGSERVTALFGARVRHSYAPYDLPGAVARFLSRVQPARVVIMETELWPNLFAALQARRLPLLIANARLSPRSYRGYGRVAGFAKQTLSRVALVAAQSEADAERFRSLGAPRVVDAGNIKFDLEIDPARLALGEQLRSALGSERCVWIGASTHEGEESALLAAHQQILQSQPQAVLILVPRHPQRFDDVAAQVQRLGLRLQRRSQWQAPATLAETQVLLGDSMGEMFAYFAASDVAFVGGSLAPIGGHNVLEPAALGLPVLFGPVMHNFLPARQLLLDAGACIETSADGIAAAVLKLLQDPAARQRMGDAGRAAVAANRGTRDRLLSMIEHLP